MKKLMIVMVIFALGNTLYAQRTEPGQPLTKQEYLTKSKNQNIGAWVLLGGGALLTAGGLIWFSSAFDIWSNNSDQTVSIVVAGVGVAAMAGSIPLFIASARNKNKAGNMTVHFKWEGQGIVKSGVMKNQRYPALSLKLGLK